jgi:phospholipid/cholesterol/gamma-HCH transport system substrate-binding protein
MRVQRSSLIKVVVFVLLTGLGIALVGITFTRIRIEDTNKYSAIFSNASGLREGLDVRASGVLIGTVKSIELHEGGVIVDFTVPADLDITTATEARIRYANLTGDRYVDLTHGRAVKEQALPPGSVIPLDRTQPALDLDTFFRGFDPLMQALDPQEINKLASNIIGVSEGESGAVRALLQSVGSFTSRLSDRDELIGDVITNLSDALGVVDRRKGDLDQLVVGLSDLLHGLAKDRKSIGNSLESLNVLAVDTADLLAKVRPGLKANVDQIGTIARNLNRNAKSITEVLDIYPSVLTSLGRAGAYGSFFNFYLCDVRVNIKIPGGPDVLTPYTSTQQVERCQFPEDR